jgi:hypothetical protein
MKICKKCSHNFEGIRCIVCKSNYSKVYYELNTHKINAAANSRYKLNKDKCKKVAKARYDANPSKIKEINRIRHKNRYASDINFKIACNLRGRLNSALKNNQKSGSAIKDLGCSIEEFKRHIEAKWESWMNWSNHGIYNKNIKTWQLDHIIALSNFNLENREELLKACHYSNYQPLETVNNIIKGNK